jgi:hypothetical protein
MRVQDQSSERACYLAAMAAWSTSFRPPIESLRRSPSQSPSSAQMRRAGQGIIRYNDVAFETTEVGKISGNNSVSHGSSAGISIHRPTLGLVPNGPMQNLTVWIAGQQSNYFS